MTSACGAIGTAVDCNAAAQEVTTITTDWSSAVTKSATDPAAMEKASQDAATKTKALASKHDGEIADALNDLATGFESVKGDMTSVSTLTTKIQDFQTKITSACS
jgi:hypothetical protein